jgi:hypothetical protein
MLGRDESGVTLVLDTRGDIYLYTHTYRGIRAGLPFQTVLLAAVVNDKPNWQ